MSNNLSQILHQGLNNPFDVKYLQFIKVIKNLDPKKIFHDGSAKIIIAN